MNLENYIATIPDFPSPGILFRDVTPLLADGEAFRYTCDQLAAIVTSSKADLVAGPESRGFLFGCPAAEKAGLGFIPVRKPGKLPRETISASYELEYGTNELFMHKDAIRPGQKVFIVDDLLATGGTTEAIIRLVEQLGGEVVGAAYVIELVDLGGREALKDLEIHSLLKY